MTNEWRTRLRAAIERTDRTHSDVALQAGITEVTLSRILNDASNPRFDTIMRVAREIDEPLSALVNDRALLDGADVRDLQTAIGILQRLLARSTGGK